MSEDALKNADALTFDSYRWVPQRYFNLLRLTLAGLFLVAGPELGLGKGSPFLFLAVSLIYLIVVLALGFPDAARRLGLNRLIGIQVVIDIVVLTALMWVSGGYRSGMPVLMMVFLAAAGLVAEGRMGVFFAAMATVAVLTENTWRYVNNANAADFLQVAISCIGFFAITFTARFLALRAKANASLAAQRGEALGRQQAVNERIIHDMQDGVIVVSSAGRVRQANPRASELLGAQLRTGMHLDEIDGKLLECRNRDDAAGGVLQRLGPEGRLLRFRALGAASEQEESGDTLIYLTDFDEIQRHMQQHKLAALGRLTASMAHEIRNPLAAVTQAAELLKEEKRAEVQLRLIRIINDNSLRIESMVRDVLALGRRDVPLSEAVALKPFVMEMIDEFSLAGDAEKAVFCMDIAEDAALAMDRAHLYQILGNLLANARRYCSGNAGSVRVFATSSGSGWTVLHVLDDGPGIDDSERNHVFEPFFTTEPKGTGLGLYIARELAESNDATLDLADNQPGAHFVLTARSSL